MSSYSVASVRCTTKLVVLSLLWLVFGRLPNAVAQYNYGISISADRTMLTAANPTAIITVSAQILGPSTANFGPCNLLGSITITLPSSVGVISAANQNNAVSPFSNAPGSEIVTNGASFLTIAGIDVFRNFDSASPPPPGSGPLPYGANALVPAYRFSLTITDFTPRTVVVSGVGRGCRITQWEYQEGLAAWVPQGTPPLPNVGGALVLTIGGGVPRVTQEPATMHCVEGRPAYFFGAAAGTPPLSYAWFHNGVPLVDDGRVTGSGTANVSISSVMPTDAGAYSYQVTNSFGSVMSTDGMLALTSDLIETVLVGNPNNEPDVVAPGDGTGVFGTVPYIYEIGKHEITWSQYATFLNAVAAADPYGLYDTDMGLGVASGIMRDGSPGSYSYTPVIGGETKPVAHVSFYSAARFCNWLHNGRPIGPQGAATTEAGTYLFTGALSIAPGTVDGRARNVGWRWAIAEEDEWYKAAYGGMGNAYTLFATRSNAAPTASLPPGPPNSANYNGVISSYTPVGAYVTSPSYWGTFDQNGNVWEMLEGRRLAPFPEFHRVRGGVYSSAANSLLSGSHSGAGDFTSGSADIGFRVVRSIGLGTTGGCCMPDAGGCVDNVTQGQCQSMGGSYQGNGSACASLPCAIPRGACCLGDGTCVPFLTHTECTAIVGRYEGDMTTCATAMCHPIGPILYVNASAPAGGDGSSWVEAMPDLAEALLIHHTYPGRVEEIWVAEGTYHPDLGSGDRMMSFDIMRLTQLYGGFAGNESMRSERNPAAHPTILSGDLQDNDGPDFTNRADNSVQVVNMPQAAGSSVFDGFVVRGGNADVGSLYGAGMSNGAGTATISNCWFLDNSSTFSGGGLQNSGAMAVIQDCVFSGNRSVSGFGGGASTLGGGAPLFIRCTFSENSGRGAGLYGWTHSTAIVADCTFADNTGTAVVFSADSSGSLTNCTFSRNSDALSAGAIVVGAGSGALTGCTFDHNTGRTGGAILAGAHVIATGCVFQSNASTTDGGAIAMSSGPGCQIVDCTFNSNSAARSGGAIRVQDGNFDTTISNCEFNNNSAGVTGGSVAYNAFGTLNLMGNAFAGGAAPSGGGVFFGLGTLIGESAYGATDRVYNSGSFRPGDTTAGPVPVASSLPGGFTNANRISEFGDVSASNLYIDLAGTTPGAQYDVIDCGPSTASIVGGTLRVNLLGAFQPAVGQHFDILTAASFTGRFDVASMPSLDAGAYVNVTYSGTGITLSIDRLLNLLSFGDEEVSPLPEAPTDALLADMNQDGLPDLVACFPASPEGSIGVFLNLGNDASGNWLGLAVPIVTPTGSDPVAIAVGRVTGDDAIDVLVACRNDNRLDVFANANDHSGSLLVHQQLTFSQPVAVACSPDRPTHDSDIVVGLRAAQYPVHWLRNVGAGTSFALERTITGSIPASDLALRDLNDDGLDDVLVLRNDSSAGSTSYPVISILDPGVGDYAPSYPYAPERGARRLLLLDLDGDSHADLVLPNTADGTLSIYKGDPGALGAFQEGSTVLVGAGVSSLVAGDLDLDGDPDLAFLVTPAGEPTTIRVLRNDTSMPGTLVLATATDIGFTGTPQLLLQADLNGDVSADVLVVRSGPRGSGLESASRLNLNRPPCPADWSDDGVVNSQDFFNFLADFFQDRADFNDDGQTNSQDFFDFLAAFFTGCP